MKFVDAVLCKQELSGIEIYPGTMKRKSAEINKDVKPFKMTHSVQALKSDQCRKSGQKAYPIGSVEKNVTNSSEYLRVYCRNVRMNK